MDNVNEYRNKLEALLTDTPELSEARRKEAIHYADQALMALAKDVLSAELSELRESYEQAFGKTDLNEEAGYES